MTVHESVVIGLIELGFPVTLTHSRYGLSGGVTCYALGYTWNHAAGTVELMIWK